MKTISLLILFAFLGVVLGGTTDPEPKDEEWWWEVHEGFKQNTIDNGENINVLFYGDSITQGWMGSGWETFKQYYEPLGTSNYAIGGDTTQNLLYRISNGEVENISPSLCVLKIGTNNIGYSDEEVAEGVIAVVNLLREKLPEMRILLLGILPRDNAETTERIDHINSMINVLDDGYMIKYFNLRNVFYWGDGVFNTDLFDPDMVHLVTAGYETWAQVMNPIFQEMLNTK